MIQLFFLENGLIIIFFEQFNNHSLRMIIISFKKNDDKIILWKWSWYRLKRTMMESFSENNHNIVQREQWSNHFLRMIMILFKENNDWIVLWEWPCIVQEKW